MVCFLDSDFDHHPQKRSSYNIFVSNNINSLSHYWVEDR